MIYAGLVSFVGAFVAWWFSRINRRLIRGILKIKEEYLFHDADYRTFYDALNSPYRGGYGFAMGVPKVVFGLWVVLVLGLASTSPHLKAALGRLAPCLFG